MNSRLRGVLVHALATVPLLCATGCMTHALWNGEMVESFHEPAAPNNLALFQTPDHHQLLAEYDEFSPWRDPPRRRAYFVPESGNRSAARRKPHFVNPNLTNGLVTIPLYSESNLRLGLADTSNTYAVPTKGNSFTVYRSNSESDGPFQLPTYRGASGNLKLALLTPITVTLDASIVGGVIGYFVLEGLAESGASFSVGH